MVTVVNKKDGKKYPKHELVYVGRGSALGNPYTSIQGKPTLATEVCDSRNESIAKYRIHLLKGLAQKDASICMEMNSIYRKALYGNVYLQCYCAPLPCHAEVIKEIIESKLK